MVTGRRIEGTEEKGKWELEGNNTDTAPNGTFQGSELMNGSSYFNMDAQTVKFWDEENAKWTN